MAGPMAVVNPGRAVLGLTMLPPHRRPPQGVGGGGVHLCRLHCFGSSMAASRCGYSVGPWPSLKFSVRAAHRGRTQGSTHPDCSPSLLPEDGLARDIVYLTQAGRRGPRGKGSYGNMQARMTSWTPGGEVTGWGFSRALGDPTGGCKKRTCLEFSLAG